MNYKTFESDENPFEYKKSGWDWLDKNIRWAKKNQIYLILNMHVPQGGFQSLGEGEGLWNNQENQERYIALWKAIAKRYKNEPIIAGYDLLNEPVVNKSIDQWKELAEKTVTAIRSADKNHLIIIEGVMGIKDQIYTYHRIDNFFLVNDENVMYEFHFYRPFAYTHQKTTWTQFADIDHGPYPDDNFLVMDMENFISQEPPSRPFNKEYLAYKLEQYIEFARKNNIPIYCGEFGVDRYCYEDNDGGEKWTADTIDLFIENNIHFTYHDYHEPWFGIFYNERTELPDPDKLHEKVVAVFKEKLKK